VPGSDRTRPALVRLLLADAVASDALHGGAASTTPQSRSNAEEGVALMGTRITAQGSPVAAPGVERRDGVSGEALNGEMQMAMQKGEPGDIFLRRRGIRMLAGCAHLAAQVGNGGNSAGGRIPVAARRSGRLRRAVVGTRTWALGVITLDARGDGETCPGGPSWSRPKFSFPFIQLFIYFFKV
jgi:hypothetical protein